VLSLLWEKCSLWGPNQVLLLFMEIWNPICPSWPLIGWHIFDFSRMLAGIYSQFGTNINVAYGVPIKCCDFNVDHKSLASYWLTHFQLLSKNSYMQGSTQLPIWHKCSLWSPDQVLILFIWIRNPISQYGHPVLWLADTFSTSSQVKLQGSSPNLTEMFLRGPYQVLLLLNVDLESKVVVLTCFQLLQNLTEMFLMGLILMWIWNLRWPPWPPDWLIYQKLIIFKTFCFKFLSGIFTNRCNTFYLTWP